MPVDDLAAARHFYGRVLGLQQGRSADTWVDWNLQGHQFVTHLAPERQPTHPQPRGQPRRPGHTHLILTVEKFHELADRLRAADTEFVIEPYVRFEGQPGEQWTMFLLDPAGNAMEFKAFADGLPGLRCLAPGAVGSVNSGQTQSPTPLPGAPPT